MRPTLALPLLIALALPVLAHDMWLVPADGARVGAPTEVEVAVGMDFPHSTSALDPERAVEPTLVDPTGARSTADVVRDEQAERTRVTFTPDAPGVWTVGMATRPRVLELAGPKFDDYLLHDGLPQVLAGRMDRGELGVDAVERYSKYVKAHVRVGASGPAWKPVELGHRVEILLLDDPFAAGLGSTLRARVLFEGRPLARANLCWDHPGNGEDFVGQTWTDAAGEALVPVGRTGPMTLRLVHMTRPRSSEYEWESFWASCTIQVPAD